MTRRKLLAAATTLAALPALALETPPQLRRYERETGGRIGLYAENLAGGATLAWRADERFVMCSTFKASLAALVLQRIDHGQEQLEQSIPYGPADMPEDLYAPVARQNQARGAMSIGEMCEAVVEYSDNICANLLLARVGGPPALTRFWRSLGDPVTRLDHNEPLLNRSPPGDPHDTTTPRAMATTLRQLVLGPALSSNARAQLTDWMLNCKTGANRLREGLPQDWKIADKTGNNAKDAFGDIAIAWSRPDAPVLICAYTQGGMPTASQVEAVFAEIGRTVGKRLG